MYRKAFIPCEKAEIPAINITVENSTSGTKLKTITVNLVVGETTVTHGLGISPSMVNFIVDGEEQNFIWKRSDDDPTNTIIITSEVAISNVEINILYITA